MLKLYVTFVSHTPLTRVTSMMRQSPHPIWKRPSRIRERHRFMGHIYPFSSWGRLEQLFPRLENRPPTPLSTDKARFAASSNSTSIHLLTFHLGPLSSDNDCARPTVAASWLKTLRTLWERFVSRAHSVRIEFLCSVTDWPAGTRRSPSARPYTCPGLEREDMICAPPYRPLWVRIMGILGPVDMCSPSSDSKGGLALGTSTAPTAPRSRGRTDVLIGACSALSAGQSAS